MNAKQFLSEREAGAKEGSRVRQLLGMIALAVNNSASISLDQQTMVMQEILVIARFQTVSDYTESNMRLLIATYINSCRQ
jgi:hypothetical protein